MKTKKNGKYEGAKTPLAEALSAAQKQTDRALDVAEQATDLVKQAAEGALTALGTGVIGAPLSFRLAGPEVERIRVLNDEQTRLKVALADVTMQLAQLQGCGGRVGEVVQAVFNKDKQLVAEVRAMARAHGINPDQNDVSLSFDTMTLTAKPVAKPVSTPLR